MIVYRPVKSNRLNQGWGANMPCAKKRADGTYKVISSMGTCPAGYEKFYPMIGLKAHNGYDNYTWHGEPLYFPVDSEQAGGWWSKNASDLDGGLGVDVISRKKVIVHGRRTHVKFRFWHLKEGFALEDVKMGDLIGFCDNTGASSGDHLHWAMKPCHSDGKSKNKRNGYYGAEDFTPWYTNEFVLDVMNVRARALTVIDAARKIIADVKIFIKNHGKNK